MDLDSFPTLLSLGFSSPTVDHEEPLSFGTLLACLNMALSNLGPVSATLVKLITWRAILHVLNVQGAIGEALSQVFVDLFANPPAVCRTTVARGRKHLREESRCTKSSLNVDDFQGKLRVIDETGCLKGALQLGLFWVASRLYLGEI